MKSIPVLTFVLAASTISLSSFAQPTANNPSGFIGWNGDTQGKFTTALCTDGAGNLWAGTEDNGLFRRAANGVWNHVGMQDGLADDSVFCLASDQQGRLWVGTGRGGVSVWNGQRWRSFSVLDGPLSERVRDIAVSPLDGAVWLATEAGISRYTDAQGWSYITRADGLPSDQIVALAFDSQGSVYAATACSGIAMAHPNDGYANWVSISGAARQPETPEGAGLPSNQINDIAVAGDNTIWVATNYGVGKSNDRGKTWFFLRGKNWAQNVQGSRWNTAVEAPKGAQTGADLLEEDWVSKIEPTDDGQVWLGYRKSGFELRDGSSGDLVYSWRDGRGPNAADPDSVRALLPMSQGALIATYGSGLQLTTTGGTRPPTFLKSPANPGNGNAPLPNPASPLTAEGMKALEAKIAALPAAPDLTAGFYATDWRTRGDWVGRYGSGYARLYAMQSPSNREIVRLPGSYRIGPETQGFHSKGGGPFYYLHDLVNTNPSTIYDPYIGKRRPGEVNDGGWQGNLYPPSWDGPDLWTSVQVPEGIQRVALYFHNLPGHDGTDRFRDYVVHIKPYVEDLKEADATPDLATARIKDFYNGGYLQFWLQGPGRFRVQVSSGNSHVTILQATLLDQIRGPKIPGDDPPMPWMGGNRYLTEETPAPVPGENETITAARQLWNAAEENGADSRYVTAAWMMRLQAYRAAAAAGANEALLANWRWKLAIWNESDEAGFDNAMAKAFKDLSEQRKPTAPVAAPVSLPLKIPRFPTGFRN